jgi:hypothetical protein
MFNLKAKILQYVARFKLWPVEYSRASDGMGIYAENADSESEITDETALVGLKPLTIAITKGVLNGKGRITIKRKNEVITRAKLFRSGICIQGFDLFHIKNICNPGRGPFRKLGIIVALAVKNKLQPNKNFVMKPSKILQLFDLCVYPRPVFILSAGSGNEGTSFPIDVVGIFNEKVLFSIRKTNHANRMISDKGAVLLSRAPYSHHRAVYSLGKSNFTRSSPSVAYNQFMELDYPSFGFDVMYIAIHRGYEAGEHICYFGSITGRLAGHKAGQLGHVPWFML